MEYGILLKKAALMSAALLLASAALFAQPKSAKVTGKVTDENGNPMAGVTVIVDGAPNLGTTTGATGDYTITPPPPARRACLLIFRI